MESSRTTSTDRGAWSTEADEPDHAEPSKEMTAVIGARIGAQMIDMAFLGVQYFGVFLALRSLLGPENGYNLLLYSSLTLPLYGGLLEGLWNGQTLGKRLLEITVVDGEGPLSLLQAFVRNLPAVALFGFGISNELTVAGLVVSPLVGLGVIAVSDRRQRLLDHLLGTYVVSDDPDDDETKMTSMDGIKLRTEGEGIK